MPKHVRLTQPYGSHNAGETATFSDAEAAMLIRKNKAVEETLPVTPSGGTHDFTEADARKAFTELEAMHAKELSEERANYDHKLEKLRSDAEVEFKVMREDLLRMENERDVANAKLVEATKSLSDLSAKVSEFEALARKESTTN